MCRTLTIMIRGLYLVGIVMLLGVNSVVWAKDTLSLAEYWGQVQYCHGGLQGACLTATGARQRFREGQLVTTPAFFAEGQYLKDQYDPDWSPIGSNNSRLQSYQAGIRQITPYGVQGRVYYNYQHQTFNNLPPIVGQNQTTASSPILELDVSLARNLAGQETRALRDLSNANAKLTYYTQHFKMRMIRAEAESAYWRLVITRHIVRIQSDALDRALALEQWVTKKSTLQLAESADRLQAQAGTQIRRLDLQAALNEEQLAAQHFNTLRGGCDNVVAENLCSAYTKALQFIPCDAKAREDVRAAEQQRNIAIANAQLGIEKNKPDLNVYASYALNGNNPSSNAAIAESFTMNYPSTAIGLRLSVPLNVANATRVRQGYHQEVQGARSEFNQKIYEDRRQWQKLVQQLANAKTRLSYAQTLEVLQYKKLLAERERLAYGRSTTYQVLLFQQDYAAAQISRLMIQDNMLQLITQLKSYGA